MGKARALDYVRLMRGVNTFTRLVECDCINGYGVGYKISGGKRTNQVCVVVFVNEKLSLRRLPMANRIPKTLRLPSERTKDGYLEFVTDVQTARFSSLAYVAKMRPAPSGISIGHIDITAGTLGGLVRDLDTGDAMILSNNHVLADSNSGSPGDPILQPGPADGGSFPADHLADLVRFVPIDFAQGASNRVDGAVARPLDPAEVVWNTVDIGPETPASSRILTTSDLGLPVKKTGRTTEHTTGFVQALAATVSVKYEMFQKARFVDQIIVSVNPGEAQFSDGGDSGSLVYDEDDNVIGLLFGGSDGTEESPGTTIINPINVVMDQLGIGLLSPGDHPSAMRRRSARK